MPPPSASARVPSQLQLAIAEDPKLPKRKAKRAKPIIVALRPKQTSSAWLVYPTSFDEYDALFNYVNEAGPNPGKGDSPEYGELLRGMTPPEVSALIKELYPRYKTKGTILDIGRFLRCHWIMTTVWIFSLEVVCMRITNHRLFRIPVDFMTMLSSHTYVDELRPYSDAAITRARIDALEAHDSNARRIMRETIRRYNVTGAKNSYDKFYIENPSTEQTDEWKKEANELAGLIMEMRPEPRPLALSTCFTE